MFRVQVCDCEMFFDADTVEEIVNKFRYKRCSLIFS